MTRSRSAQHSHPFSKSDPWAASGPRCLPPVAVPSPPFPAAGPQPPSRRGVSSPLLPRPPRVCRHPHRCPPDMPDPPRHPTEKARGLLSRGTCPTPSLVLLTKCLGRPECRRAGLHAREQGPSPLLRAPHQTPGRQLQHGCAGAPAAERCGEEARATALLCGPAAEGGRAGLGRGRSQVPSDAPQQKEGWSLPFPIQDHVAVVRGSPPSGGHGEERAGPREACKVTHAQQLHTGPRCRWEAHVHARGLCTWTRVSAS